MVKLKPLEMRALHIFESRNLHHQPTREKAARQTIKYSVQRSISMNIKVLIQTKHESTNISSHPNLSGVYRVQNCVLRCSASVGASVFMR